MKFTTALVSLVAAVQAGGELYAQHPAEHTVYPEDLVVDYGAYPEYANGDGYGDYFENPAYVQPDYDTEWSNGRLPGPDFNKQCYEFDTCGQIWDQDSYEYRVEVEAKLLVGIEALKESIQMLKSNMALSEQNIMDNNMSIRMNQRMIYANMDDIITSIPISQARVGVLQGRALSAQVALEEDLTALVLYCQQFAWAPEMVAPCAEILICSGRELPYRTALPVVEYVDEYIHQEPYAEPYREESYDQYPVEQVMPEEMYYEEMPQQVYPEDVYYEEMPQQVYPEEVYYEEMPQQMYPEEQYYDGPMY